MTTVGWRLDGDSRVRARGIGLHRRGGGPMAAGGARNHRLGRQVGAAGRAVRFERGRGPGSGLRGPGRAALGPARAGGLFGVTPGHPAGPHRPGRAGGDRIPDGRRLEAMEADSGIAVQRAAGRWRGLGCGRADADPGRPASAGRSSGPRVTETTALGRGLPGGAAGSAFGRTPRKSPGSGARTGGSSRRWPRPSGTDFGSAGGGPSSGRAAGKGPALNPEGPGPTPFMQRSTSLDRIRSATEPLDILVVGGGATGLGAAVDAAAGGTGWPWSSSTISRREPRAARPSSSTEASATCARGTSRSSSRPCGSAAGWPGTRPTSSTTWPSSSRATSGGRARSMGSG